MRFQKPLFVVLTTLVLSACNATAKPGQVTIYISTQAKQCEPGTGTSLKDSDNALANAGINTERSACGVHGMPIMAMCGAKSADIHLHTIDEKDLATAESLGYKSVDKLAYKGEKGYREQTCSK
ncbi:hypothetical protein HR060_05585 [Catenovulum sp. SM1970]|uniref:hypothetical protein n=1 Tax=Marinifaba aquimaris TaxID=2741323 RepID=UPI001572A3B6|nr:hypothetical protein [Marinifaba aquimaris]NTS76335.1 hypothetical protein [Marinifaba aquimaris]